MFRSLTWLLAITLLALIIIPPLSTIVSYSQNTVGGQSEEGIWYRSNHYVNRPSGAGFYLKLPATPFEIKVLSLNGDAYDRGFEYGFLAGPEIYRTLTWMYKEQAYNQGLPAEEWRERLEMESKLYVEFIPKEYLEEMNGIADGFNSFQKINNEYTLGYNLTLYDIIAINTKINITGVGAAVSGNLTVTGASIIGTTIETPAPKSAMIYIVETPTQGHGHRIAYYTIAGRIFQNGFNDAGLGLIADPVEYWKGVIGIPEVVRNRIIIQYADNASEAVSILLDLYKKYGISGLGDDLAITDKQGNIVKIEVTPFRIAVTTNPEVPPTWPPEDPYLQHINDTKSVYSKLYLTGYSNILRGSGWIVNSLYTLNKTVTGIPGHPENWSEALSPDYSWMWRNPRAYLLAHYIYDNQLRHSQLSLEKLVEFTQTPPFADSSSSAGLVWMEPQLGIVSLVNGYTSLGKPVYIDVFIPVPNLQPRELSYWEIHSSALNLRLSTAILSELIDKMESMIHTTTSTPGNINRELENISKTLVKSSAELERLTNQMNEMENQCITMQQRESNISKGLAGINSKMSHVYETNNAIIRLQETAMILLAVLVILEGYTAWKARGNP
ncbi:MAG: hypothetical protein GSR79_10295 [Desulfurococcales archaeon]|nr:hypothetical protein [Desulfurococcales archaeon]